MFACNLFPYNDLEISDNNLRDQFGGWMTTKNVVDAIVNSIGFTTWTVVQGQNGLDKFFNVTAQVAL
jgi:hypothetical protein